MGTPSDYPEGRNVESSWDAMTDALQNTIPGNLQDLNNLLTEQL